ncbi:plasmid recombination protein, partial [Acinetobacter guillouiae]|uniref:plasmid recombination protein n=1 Tax=Acinetobacter guillouiae TaxID=106649 RepID=UPI003AF420A4
AIVRAAKLKTMGNFGGSVAHNYRSIATPNADPSKTPGNFHSLPNAEDGKNAISERLPDKRRSDAVLCGEYMITASPEWPGWNDDRQNEYF